MSASGRRSEGLRRPLAWLVAAAAAAASLATPSPAAAATPGYVSVLFGRMQWVSTAACTRLPNTVTLGQAHDDMAARGIDGVGVVIPERTPETGFRCFSGYTTQPGWDLLQAWEAEGWRFVSGGSHRDIRTLSYPDQVQESCGSLKVFDDHGIDGSGLYAYGDNAWSVTVQTDPVQRCFDFGRRYGSYAPNRKSTTVAPWFQTTHSVKGGKCNDSALACYNSVGSAGTRYQLPSWLAEQMQADPDTWFAIQFYRFVTGARSGVSDAWDCTSPDPTRHWTSKAELYCYSDFLQVMDVLQAAIATGGVVAADPATVAQAWGRVRTPPAPGEPRTTSTSVSCGLSSCTATVRDVDDGTPVAPGGVVQWSSTAGALGSTSCVASGVVPTAACTVPFTPSGSSGTVTATFTGSATHAPSTGSVTVGADAVPPTVDITAPADGAHLTTGTKVQIKVAASDAGGVESVAFVIGGTLRFTDLVAPYGYAWQIGAKAGSRIAVEAIATDTADNHASDRITVTIVA